MQDVQDVQAVQDENENQRQNEQHVFDWDWYFEDIFQNNWLSDFTGRRGVLVDIFPIVLFQAFFPDEAFELMCEQTNLHSLNFFHQPVKFSARSRFNSWTDTTVSELHAYVALQIAMGLCQKNEIKDYWSFYWLIHTPFTKAMTRDRFENYLVIPTFC